MSTKAKNALAERIRSVLAHDNSVDLPQAVVAVLAEAAILLEVQCEEAKVLFDLIPIVVNRLVPSQGPGFAGGLSDAHLQDLQALHDAWHANDAGAGG